MSCSKYQISNSVNFNMVDKEVSGFATCLSCIRKKKKKPNTDPSQMYSCCGALPGEVLKSSNHGCLICWDCVLVNGHKGRMDKEALIEWCSVCPLVVQRDTAEWLDKHPGATADEVPRSITLRQNHVLPRPVKAGGADALVRVQGHVQAAKDEVSAEINRLEHRCTVMQTQVDRFKEGRTAPVDNGTPPLESQDVSEEANAESDRRNELLRQMQENFDADDNSAIKQMVVHMESQYDGTFDVNVYSTMPADVWEAFETAVKERMAEIREKRKAAETQPDPPEEAATATETAQQPPLPADDNGNISVDTLLTLLPPADTTNSAGDLPLPPPLPAAPAAPAASMASAPNTDLVSALLEPDDEDEAIRARQQKAFDDEIAKPATPSHSSVVGDADGGGDDQQPPMGYEMAMGCDEGEEGQGGEEGEKPAAKKSGRKKRKIAPESDDEEEASNTVNVPPARKETGKKRKEPESEPAGQLEVAAKDKAAYNRHIAAKGTDAQWLEKQEAKKQKADQKRSVKVVNAVSNKEKLKQYDDMVKQRDQAVADQQKERDAKRKQSDLVKRYKAAVTEIMAMAIDRGANASDLDDILYKHVKGNGEASSSEAAN